MHLDQQNFMPVDIAVFIVSRVCRGLAYAHQKCDRDGRLLGIVHRDVGPRNIMVAREGDVKLTDFGIAKALDLMYNEEGHTVVGKDAYLSPEQANLEVTDARADLFACGIVLAELLLLQNIFEDENEDPRRTRENIRSMELPDFRSYRDDIDEKLNNILHQALTKNRDERFQTATDMLEALEKYIYSDGYGPTNEKLATYLGELTENQRNVTVFE
jgi:serine/threonine-protein kinase